jgi:hypothetical protein
MAAFMPAILALSLSSKIEQYGAYAGFASVIGLAVLSLLYFAQAREVKRLREWAGRAPERAAELQERVAADAQRRVVAQPIAQARPAATVPVTAAAQQTGAGAAAGSPAVPGAPQPAGVPAAAAPAAPATAAAATAAGAIAAGSQPTTVQPAAAPATNGDGKGSAGVPPVHGSPGAPAAPGVPVVPGPTPPREQPVAPGAAAAATAGGAVGAGLGATQIARPGQPLRAPSAVGPQTAASRRGGAGAGGAAPFPSEDPERSPARTTLAIVGAVAVALVLVVLFVTQVIGGGGSQTASTPRTNTIAPTPSGSTTAGGSTTPSVAAVKPANVTVAVLNGTTVPGLARGVGTRIESAGFKLGNVTNAADQARAATLVEYAPGKNAEAQAVARRIGVGADAIRAMDSGTRVIAGQDAAVVVTVGSDQNQQTP